MAINEVKIRDFNNNQVSVVCPLCTDGTRIARDPTAWRLHMETYHSADSSSWAATYEFGGAEGLVDGYATVVHYAHKCYGCGSTFATKALLVTHLSSAHSAS